MILPLYFIGSAIALVVLAIKLRDTREALRQMIKERSTYAQIVEARPFQSASAGNRRRPGE